MDTKRITCMKQFTELLMEAWPFGHAGDILLQHMKNDEDAYIYCPDFGIEARGFSDAEKACAVLSQKTKNQFHLLHTFGERTITNGNSQTTCNSFGYEILKDKGGEKIQFSYWRIEIESWPTGGSRFIKSFSALKLIHMNPWCYDHTSEPGIFNLSDEDIEMYWQKNIKNKNICFDIEPDDYVRIRNVVNRYLYGSPEDQLALSRLSEKSYWKNPFFEVYKTVGADAVGEGYHKLQQLENSNAPHYMWKVFAANDPLIMEFKPDRIHLRTGTGAYQFYGKAYGETKVPYPMMIRIGISDMILTKADNWRVESYEFISLLNPDKQDYIESKAPHTLDVSMERHAPKMQKDENLNAEDVYQIETILDFWTTRLKRGGLEDFVDEYMINDSGKELHLLSGTAGYEKVRKTAKKMLTDILEKEPSMRKYPQFHNGGVPVIEISDDGTEAEMMCVDYCFGNIGMGILYNEHQKERTYYPGLGLYYNRYVKDHGEWKMYSLGTNNDGLFNLPDLNYTVGHSGGWSEHPTEKLWPMPFEEFHY